MPTAEARVETERASRYLVQLCRHAQQMGRHSHYGARAHTGGDAHRPPEVQHVEWSDTHGTVRVSLGQWTMQATADALTLRAEADTEEDLQRIQQLVAGRIEKIGRRDRLTVTWHRLEATGLWQNEPAPPEGSQPREEMQHPSGARPRRSFGVIGGVVALIIVAHLVLGGSVLAASRWLGWGAGALVVAVVLAKVIGIGTLAARHGHLRTRKRASGHGSPRTGSSRRSS
ncbi:DUF2218 domain-containing protein [Streptomyces sp. NPDC047043]|uniref:DUF2218 domain-containing protein n=1 Tax=Streptomyces sp. NPDC047043 TaxID=3154497 RepID=UPI0033EF22F7